VHDPKAVEARDKKRHERFEAERRVEHAYYERVRLHGACGDMLELAAKEFQLPLKKLAAALKRGELIITVRKADKTVGPTKGGGRRTLSEKQRHEAGIKPERVSKGRG
jgi:hypothetical protein